MRICGWGSVCWHAAATPTAPVNFDLALPAASEEENAAACFSGGNVRLMDMLLV